MVMHKNNTYLVSIIIPVFKVEKYIERCLLSVINQDYFDYVIECIIVNDCTPDNSMCIASKLITEYKGSITFKLINCKENGGLSVARNIGISNATGKYLFFLDSDDYLTDNSMRAFIEKVTEYPHAEMIMGNNINSKTGKAFINEKKIPKGLIDNFQLMELYYQKYIPVMAWNTMVLRDLIVKNQLFFTPGIINEDMIWATHLYPCINSFIFIPQSTLVYEFNPSSIMNSTSQNTEKYIKSQCIIAESLITVSYNKHEVSNTIYIISYLMEVLDVIRRRGYSSDLSRILKVRKQVLKRTICHGRLILFSFGLLLFPPLNQLCYVRLFRRNYNKIEYVVRQTASLFEIFHTVKD